MGKETSHWRGIDNTGKIFPATSNKRDTRVFRLYSVINEPVKQEYLQEALERTLKIYPSFLAVIRKGFFWYYMEKSTLTPIVHEENKVPCSSIYIRDQKSLLFDVTYCENKINLEVFHALTDGTGAVAFIKELTKNYICAAHPEVSDISLQAPLETAKDYERDSFDKYYEKKKSHIKKDKVKTMQLHGAHCEPGNLKLFEKVYKTQDVLNKAKEYGVSVTVFLASVLMCAIKQEAHSRNKRPVGLMIPVNLRKYFPSETMTNFFGWISPSHDFVNNGDKLENVIESVSKSFSKELEPDRVFERMNDLVKIEKNPFLRGVPLEFKIIFMRLAASMSSDDITAVYSNVGRINLPSEYKTYIQRFGFFVSTPKLQLCTCSFENEFSVSFTSAFEDENIQRNFVRILQDIGIEEEKKETPYPEKVEKTYQGLLFVKIFSFAMIALIVGTLVINSMVNSQYPWAMYVVLGAGCMWVESTLAYFKRRNPFKNAIWQQIMVTLICVVWDFFTGWKGWALGIAFPAVNLVVFISMLIISLVMKQHIRTNMIYFLMSAAIGIIPIVFVVTNIIKFALIAKIGSAVSFLLLTGIIIFMWKDVKIEIRKKFHV